ncbi:MAG: hypothetical protein DCF15_20880 [Phormidesmis priestleyi]|uniref:FtsK domain-containing protein n=1 Tax=Phormidesmis priestleyi TaxID=268141 RepID=A0A2W4WMC3_9CYAN|nr:MAG: hypothetical protein DCF15_20880 [Phormidesmis priestleyi]
MSLMQAVRDRFNPFNPSTQPDREPIAVAADPAVQLQVELKAVITALLQAPTPEAQAEIYRTVAAELSASGTDHDEVRAALSAIYPDSITSAQLISDNLAAHGYRKNVAANTAAHGYGGNVAANTTTIQPEIERRPSTIPASAPTEMALPTYAGKIDYYEGSLLAETIAGGAFSIAIVGAPKAGASTLMRAFIWPMIYRPSGQRPTIELIDTRCDYWQGLEQIPGLVVPVTIDDMSAIQTIALKIEQVYGEVKERQKLFRAEGRFAVSYSWKPYLFGINGWGEVMDYLAKLTPKQVEEDEVLKPMFTRLRYILAQGADVGVSCLLTARAHDRIFPDNRSLEETQLLLLGRLTDDYRGGYGAIDRAINDKAQLPAHGDRAHLMALLSYSKQVGQPVLVALSGRPRMAKLPDLSEHNHHDFARAYNRLKPY